MQIQKTIREFVGENTTPEIDRSATVAEALALMESKHSACVLVVEDKVLVGIFTERDFLSRVVGARLTVGDTRVGEVMTENPDALKIDDCITYAVNLMAVGGYRNVPIVDDSHHPVSNVSVYDVTSHLAWIFAEAEEIDDDVEWTDLGGGG